VDNVCGSPSCTPETDTALCARLGKQCGGVTAVDNCGGNRTVDCGGCTAPQTCGGGGTDNLCGCTPETDAAFCSRKGKNCGPVSGTDNCGATRTVSSCGSCTAPQTCGGGGTANVCACKPETNAAFCSRLGKNCGTVSGTDNCGAARTVSSCGSCTSPKSCGGGGQDNVCGCTPAPETDEEVCQRLGKNCGALWATDSCGNSRYVSSCGTCTAPDTCGGGTSYNVCGCTSESDAAFCGARGANCGTVSGVDRCGKPRTATCGSCASPRECGSSGTPNLCTLPLGDYPGVAMTKLSSDSPIAFFASPDEQHVAYSTNRSDSPFGCFGRIGLGNLYVASLGSPPTVHKVESNAGFNETFFMADSAHLVYTRYDSYDPCTSFTDLMRAKSDGSSPTWLTTTSYFTEIQGVGASVFYREKSYSSGDPGYLTAYSFAGNREVDLGRGAYLPGRGPAPDGSAAVYSDASNVWMLRKLTTYTPSGTPLLVAPQKYLYDHAWSPDSTRLAFVHSAGIDGTATLSVISADGTGRRDLVADCRCQYVYFSPDGTRVAYEGTDAAGNPRLTLQPLDGGEAVVLTGLPSRGGSAFRFSPDGRWVRLELSSGFLSYRLFLADTSRSGAFVELTANYARGFTATSTWDYVAAMVLEPSTYVMSARVFPTASGTAQVPVSSGVNWLDYEHVASTPRLAVFHSPPSAYEWGTLSLFGTDGSGPARVVTPEAYTSSSNWSIARPFWSGRVLLYSVNRRVDPASGEYVFDLAASTSDGATSGLVARDVLQVRSVSNPSRVFFTRSRQSGGGLWVVELPR
jgi:Tol biopolymer transport system component